MSQKYLFIALIIIANLLVACDPPTPTPPSSTTSIYTPVPSPPSVNRKLTISTDPSEVTPISTPSSEGGEQPDPPIQNSGTISTTGILFLVDVSNSVVKLCDEDRQTGPQIVRFITTFLSEYYDDLDAEKFGIGVGTFPVLENETYDFSLKSLDVYRNTENWYGLLEEEIAGAEDVYSDGSVQGVNRLEYIGAIEQSANTLREGEFEKSIIVLLTDGMVRYKLYNEDKEQAEWDSLLSIPSTQDNTDATLLEDILNDDVMLHTIVLPCLVERNVDLDAKFPEVDYVNNIVNWNSLFGKNTINLFPSPLDYKLDDPSSISQNTFVANAIYDFLITYDFVKQVDGFPKLVWKEEAADSDPTFPVWSIPGNTKTMNMNIVSWGLTNWGIFENGAEDPDDFIWEELFGKYYYKNIAPHFSCPDIDFQISAEQEYSQDNFLALYWGNLSLPDFPFQIWYKDNPIEDDAGISIINQTEFDFETKITEGATTFSECYEMRVELVGETSGNVYDSHQKPIDSSLNWQIKYDPADWQHIEPNLELRVSLVHKNNGEEIVTNPRIIPIHFSFSPELISKEAVLSEDDSALEIPFQYATGDYYPDSNAPQPQIYIVSTLKSEDQQDVSACEKLGGFVLSEGDTRIEAGTITNVNDTSAYYTHPVTVTNDQYDNMVHGSRLWLSLKFHQDWINSCQYEFVAVRWPDEFKEQVVWCKLSSDGENPCADESHNLSFVENNKQ